MTLPLDRSHPPGAAPVALGLRPRDLVLGDVAGMLPIRGRVYVVEPLGRQREVTVEIGEHRVAVVTPHEDVSPGDLVTISVAPERILLFDGASGRRIADHDGFSSPPLGSANQPEAVGYA